MKWPWAKSREGSERLLPCKKIAQAGGANLGSLGFHLFSLASSTLGHSPIAPHAFLLFGQQQREFGHDTTTFTIFKDLSV